MIRSTLLRSVATGVLTLIVAIHGVAGKEGKPLSIRADVNWTLGTQAADFFFGLPVIPWREDSRV
ncbi:MAG: hypothetical protein UZ06_CHB003000590 [Chlorobi bacterium OLB6]|nr:MAG: hypothetical protein UZ06_CHB003000590 [Chlorobi bacterium OLB6]